MDRGPFSLLKIVIFTLSGEKLIILNNLNFDLVVEDDLKGYIERVTITLDNSRDDMRGSIKTM